MATFFESKHVVPFNLSICDGHDSVLWVHLCVYVLANSSFDLFFFHLHICLEEHFTVFSNLLYFLYIHVRSFSL